MKRSAAKPIVKPYPPMTALFDGEPATHVPYWRPALKKAHTAFAVSTAFVLCLLFTNPCMGQTTVWVGGPGDLFATIQDAIDCYWIGPGSTVIVRDGTYKGVGNTNIDFKGKAITIRSENGPASCTIDGENLRRGFIFQNNEGFESVVEGFTITRGRNLIGGGIACIGASPTIINCTITGNIADDFGGGIYLLQSTAKISKCTITSNHAGDDGGGIYLNDSPAAITNCNISLNHSTYWGAGIRSISSSPAITNCTISGNNGSNGGGISCSGGSPIITNCMITGNFGTGADGAGIYLTGSNATITNCIIAKNTATYWGGGVRSISSSPIITNCTITENKGSTGGGISCSGSNHPTIVNSILWANTATNTGPQVYHSDSPSTPLITYSDIQGSYPGDGNINEEPFFDSPSTANYHLQQSSPCIDFGTSYGAPASDIRGLSRPQGKGCDMGAYEYAPLIHVPDHFKTIQEGIDAVAPGHTVVVRDGTYKGDGNTNIDFRGKKLTLRSEKGAANCIIDGEEVNRGFYFHSGEGSESILSGFTIRRCYGDHGGGIRFDSSSPTIINCMITKNTASAKGGGIASNSSSPTIINCLIAENNGWYGGGVSLDSSSPTIINCTITNNLSPGGTTEINSECSSPIITNSIEWGDSSFFGCSHYSPPPVFTYSDTWWAGFAFAPYEAGNIRSDPLFVSPSTGNYHLRSTSPCINKGTSSGAPSFDIDGTSRPGGAGYDMGAYEYKPSLDFLPLLLGE